MWKKLDFDKDKEKALIEMGYDKLVARLISQSDVDLNKINDFLKSDYSMLNDPYALNDMEKAAFIFIDVARKSGRVAVIGDYDADGVVSSCMIHELCRYLRVPCKVFLPSRILHGYGLNENTIRDFLASIHDSQKPDLLIITDCGTNNYEEIKRLKEYGIENVIVIDHHIVNHEIISKNADALINWHLSNGYNEMCACGQVFQFIRAINRLEKKISPVEFLSYAAVGTISDVSPVIGDNRIIIKNGLSKHALNNVLASGLSSLLKECKLSNGEITQSDIAFKVTPRINAVGRIADPKIAFRLLTEYDSNVADTLAKVVSGYNNERKKMQKKIEDKAIAKMEKLKFNSGIFLADPSWHVGIVGVVASKLVELFGVPSIMVGKNGDVWKGSGRTIPGVDVKKILDDCSYIFESYGGHSSAVGVTLKEEYKDSCFEIFDEACGKNYNKKELEKNDVRYYNASLKISAINSKNAQLVQNYMSPFCSEHNKEPVFLLENVKLLSPKVYEGDNWRLLSFQAEKNNEIASSKFSFFTKNHGLDIEGCVGDIYFSFPQNLSGKYCSMNVVDLEIKEKTS